MENRYSCLLESNTNGVRESPQAYQFITERHLQALWMDQKYLHRLTTVDDKPLQVISPGLWNVEAGPDFRKAHLKIGDKEYLGDIEIHFNDDAWYQHSHHQDERYNQVVLHVSLWNPKHHSPIITANQKAIQQVHLENSLTVPVGRVAQLIDLDLYPYRKFIGSGRCAHEIFNESSEDQARRFFQKAADWRLEQKLQFLQARVKDGDNFAGAGIAMALGYKNNTEAFLELYLEMRSQPLLNADVALAWLMARTGFFDQHFVDKWGESARYRQLRTLGTQFSGESVKLVLNQIRPMNHPIRRFVYMAHMRFDRHLTMLPDTMWMLWQQSWKAAYQSKKWLPFLAELLDLIPDYTDAYWNSHFLFEALPRNEFLVLMGEDLKKEIVINLFIPILKGRMLDATYEELSAFRSFYSILTASKTGKTKYLTHRFFGDGPKGAILHKADCEQGAYQLHHDFCVHFEASCEGCPFVQRFKQHFN